MEDVDAPVEEETEESGEASIRISRQSNSCSGTIDCSEGLQ